MRFLKGGVLVVSLLAIYAVANPAVGVDYNQPRPEMLFSEGRAKAWVETLTAPEYAGRGSDDAGYMQAAQLVADEVQRLGFQPLDKSFVVPFSWTRAESSEHTGGHAHKNIVHRTANVMGWLPGDTKEIVLIGAHLDHLGHKKDDRTIYAPGADDNASGVAAVLEVARALVADYHSSERRGTRRSVVVAFWGAEEQGMIGSGYFVNRLMSGDNPYPFSLKDIVAVINLDMVGRGFNGEAGGADRAKSVLAIGPPETPVMEMFRNKSPIMHALMDKYAWRSDVMLTFRYDDNNQKLFKRSDMFSFFSKNTELATLFLTGPLHEDYHSVTDTAEKLDYDRLIRIARFAYYVVSDLVTTDKHPRCIQCG